MFTLVGPPRSLTARLATLLLTAAALRLTYLLFSPHSEARGLSLFQYAFSHPPHHGGGTCPPEAWAAGRWAARPPLTDRTRMSASEEAYEFLGFEGCASNREHWWHLGADKEQLFDRFPGVASWRWEPPRACDIQDLGAAALVKHLVEDGGWMLVGGESFQS